MDTIRFVVSDGMWCLIAGLLPGKSTDRGVTASDTRLFLESVLWRVRTGSPWRGLPLEFGNWNSSSRRFRRWARDGVFEVLFDHVSGDPDMEYALIDGMTVSVHQKATGAKAWAERSRSGDSQSGPFG
jgi:transposase